jgi:hypothetical protein
LISSDMPGGRFEMLTTKWDGWAFLVWAMALIA